MTAFIPGCGDEGCECHHKTPDVLLGVAVPGGRAEFAAAFVTLAELLASEDRGGAIPAGIIQGVDAVTPQFAREFGEAVGRGIDAVLGADMPDPQPEG